jgi:hypothetical protein
VGIEGVWGSICHSYHMKNKSCFGGYSQSIDWQTIIYLVYLSIGKCRIRAHSKQVF